MEYTYSSQSNLQEEQIKTEVKCPRCGLKYYEDSLPSNSATFSHYSTTASSSNSKTPTYLDCSWHSGNYNSVLDVEAKPIVDNDFHQVSSEPFDESQVISSPIYEWSCCKASSQYATGCVHGPHLVAPTRFTIGQKLEGFFSDQVVAFPPSSTANRQARQRHRNRNNNQDEVDGDDDVDDNNGFNIHPIRGNAPPAAIPQALPIGNNINAVIDNAKCYCLNESSDHILDNAIRGIFGAYLESDCDAELLITIGFLKTTRISIIRIDSINVEQAPATIKIFLNRPNLAFDSAQETDPELTFVLDRTSYPNDQAILKLPAAKFARVSFISLYITGNVGDEATTVVRRLTFYN